MPRCIFPRLLMPMPLCLRKDTANLHLCRRPSNIHRQVWLSVLWGHCSFPAGTGVHRFCLCPPRVECLIPSGLWKFYPAGLQSQIPWGFPAPLPDPQTGEPDVGPRIFTKVQELLWYYFLQFVGRSPGG